MAAEHDHPRHPEEENVEAGDQQLRGIESRQIGGDLRPSKDGKRQQPRREPGVEHVGFLRDLRAAAVPAGAGRLAGDSDLLARRAMPRRNAMAPPQLPRDAPVMDVPHPLEVGLAILVRTDLDVALLDSGDGLVGERLDLHEPLRRQPRLDNILRAVAPADAVGVFFDGDKEALRLKVGDNAGARLVAIKSGVDAAF